MNKDISPSDLRKHIEQKASKLTEKAFLSYCDRLITKVQITPLYKADYPSRKRALCFRGLQLTYNLINNIK